MNKKIYKLFCLNIFLTILSCERNESELQKGHMPLSRISIELLLSAYKFRILDNNDLRLDGLKPGELQELLRESGGSGIIRLRDGSLRF